jgi:hypothetical protein
MVEELKELTLAFRGLSDDDTGADEDNVPDLDKEKPESEDEELDDFEEEEEKSDAGENSGE